MPGPEALRFQNQGVEGNFAVLDYVGTILGRSQSVDTFISNCYINSLYPQQVASLLESPQNRKPFIDKYSKNPDLFAYQLALASYHASFDSLTDEQVKNLGVIKSGGNLGVKIFHPSWDLCFRSEDYMRQALNKGKSLLTLNGGTLLAKSKGYKTILALETFATERGMIVARNWYSPEGEAKNVIHDAFARGEKEADISEGTLVLMRPITDGKASERLFERARSYVAGTSYERSRIEKIRDEIAKAL